MEVSIDTFMRTIDEPGMPETCAIPAIAYIPAEFAAVLTLEELSFWGYFIRHIPAIRLLVHMHQFLGQSPLSISLPNLTQLAHLIGWESYPFSNYLVNKEARCLIIPIGDISFMSYKHSTIS